MKLPTRSEYVNITAWHLNSYLYDTTEYFELNSVDHGVLAKMIGDAMVRATCRAREHSWPVHDVVFEVRYNISDKGDIVDL